MPLRAGLRQPPATTATASGSDDCWQGRGTALATIVKRDPECVAAVVVNRSAARLPPQASTILRAIAESAGKTVRQYLMLEGPYGEVSARGLCARPLMLPRPASAARTYIIGEVGVLPMENQRRLADWLLRARGTQIVSTISQALLSARRTRILGGPPERPVAVGVRS